jgi:hypothetical protein
MVVEGRLLSPPLFVGKRGLKRRKPIESNETG